MKFGCFSFLAGGSVLCTPGERVQIKVYEASLLDGSGRLVPSAMPHFIPPVQDGRAKPRSR
ncbi:MAG TPA: hypothetical protein VEM40_11865 [Nitrospirota bacterium]|nr:hypothetical protein [Nitrospirota bacterium]